MFGGHAPYRLKNAVWENERNNFVDNVMNVIDDFAPGFSSQVIDMPVLLLVGEHDTPFRNGIDYMANKIADSEKHIFAGAGHGVNIEQPEGVNAALGGFLARISGAAV